MKLTKIDECFRKVKKRKRFFNNDIACGSRKKSNNEERCKKRPQTELTLARIN